MAANYWLLKVSNLDMKLSTRLAAAKKLTYELREECALMLGFRRSDFYDHTIGQYKWERDGVLLRRDMLKLDLTEIVGETRKRGWEYALGGKDGYACAVIRGFEHEVHRTDQDDQLAALTALVMALENEDGQ